jgi:polyisoprenoid-binding protein YceI
MKRIIQLIILFFVQVPFAQTGIGTTTPVNKFQIETTLVDPAISGTAANGNLRLSGTTGSHVLDFGLSSTSTSSWLQSRSRSNYGTNFNLVFNPNGGQVGIGTLAPSTTLTVGNATGTIPGEIMLNPTATLNEGGQITFKRSLSGGTVDWTMDHFGTSNAESRFRIFGGSLETNGLIVKENGNIGLGTASPQDRLDIRSAMSVNEIKFRGTDGGDDSDPYRLRKSKVGDLNELQLHLNDDWNEQFAIYGNSCLTAGCPEYSVHLYHYFRADGDVYHRGKMGIGTTSPQVPLHVASSVAQYVNVYGYLNQNQAQGAYTANTNVYYSILAEQRIRAPEFNAISDARIKKNIFKLSTEKQLAELNQLKVVNYAYIDQLANGTKSKTGFIAQEVEAVNPKFVNQSTDFIPSVYALAQSATIENKMLHVTTVQPHGFQKGDEVKLFAEGKKEVVKTIEDVSGPQSFTVSDWIDPIDNVFVYGKKVTDFKAIDFDQITALSVGAIQELHQQIETLKRENASLKKTMIDTIQKQQFQMEQRLLQIERKLRKKKR